MEKLNRLQSGIEGLDALLKGGLVSGASYIIQGRPGSGKTILANQLGFHHARNGGRVLVATLLAESHDRLFQFLSTLSFFDAARVGAEIQFVSAFDTLENEGLDEVVKLLRREISRQKATVMVVDGLLNARSKADSPIDTKKFISELQGHAAFAGCTVLFLTSSRLDDGSPEHTMVDGVIEMGEELFGTRSVRRIQLRKTRGSGALTGLHECEITNDGLVVYPRLESLYGRPSAPDSADLTRIPSGITSLDAILGGGLHSSSVTLVMGPSGIGKTTLGLKFLSESTVEAPGLHFGFYESPQRLQLKGLSLGIDLQQMQDSGALSVAWQPTTEGLLDGLGARLLRLVEEKGIKRLFIDSLSGMTRVSTNPARITDFYSALMNELRARGVTVFATWEMHDLFGSEVSSPASELSSIADNLMLMRFFEIQSELRRTLSILKVRDSFYDPSLLEVVIRDQAVDLRKVSRNAPSVVSNSALPGSAF
ncbi:serine/threonine protein kinase [Pseudomonas lurida]|uniref:non-specific serine/threonine protein kinase n=1 Tax=Pseudomonas quebecensis TaxID=2995174 RepID=A0ABY6QMN6_9PSED|nr:MULTISPECIES: ATPase domain-containing protein [Pseudomonas]MBA1296443.1 serine/threonine protein kinase [Pseudomonas lurida]MCP1511901.1 circadian clock protein KaiC [Pseudomonas rhodesiae]MCX4063873.1 serine/threonine protein kinase [Pseudomonas quebecensis]MDF9770730.1 circadian clock protein KaiC [Pseudomonas rhodesiae]UZW20243.1 serine/threonine protein kinase [Pseudomonas quebecensis]